MTGPGQTRTKQQIISQSVYNVGYNWIVELICTEKNTTRSHDLMWHVSQGVDRQLLSFSGALSGEVEQDMSTWNTFLTMQSTLSVVEYWILISSGLQYGTHNHGTNQWDEWMPTTTSRPHSLGPFPCRQRISLNGRPMWRNEWRRITNEVTRKLRTNVS